MVSQKGGLKDSKHSSGLKDFVGKVTESAKQTLSGLKKSVSATTPAPAPSTAPAPTPAPSPTPSTSSSQLPSATGERRRAGETSDLRALRFSVSLPRLILDVADRPAASGFARYLRKSFVSRSVSSGLRESFRQGESVDSPSGSGRMLPCAPPFSWDVPRRPPSGPCTSS